MSHVTHMDESCHTRGWVMSHTWMSHVTHMDEFCHTHGWVMSHTWMRHVTHMVESCHTHGRVMSHTWMSHVTHMNKSCVISHINEAFLPTTHSKRETHKRYSKEPCIPRIEPFIVRNRKVSFSKEPLCVFLFCNYTIIGSIRGIQGSFEYRLCLSLLRHDYCPQHVWMRHVTHGWVLNRHLCPYGWVMSQTSRESCHKRHVWIRHFITHLTYG